MRRSVLRIAGAAVWLLAVTPPAPAQTIDPLNIPDTQLEPVKWSDLNGWTADDHAAAFATFRTSCEPFNKQRRLADQRPVAAALKAICKRAAAAGPLKADKARAFFEENFRPVRIAKLGETTGLITGYYEPIVEGSRFPHPAFSVPLYRRPRDLVIQNQKTDSAPFPNRAVVGRYNDKKEFEPYYDRLAIEDGALDGQKLEICYVADPFVAISIQIQGSARIRLEDGTLVRLNYDAHNGFGYTAIGRILIERNLVPREEMTMDRIKQWMRANPDQAKEVRGTNRSFVFFRITGLNNDDEPVGAQGVKLTPGRSIAVDKTHVYGTPFFIESDLPIDSAKPTTKFRRLMVSQDTGSAIQGPARADLYWGAGDAAGKVAGRLKQQGRFTMLMPRELDIVAAGKLMPLPVAKPANLPDPKPPSDKDKTAKTEPAKTETIKTETTKTDPAKTEAIKTEATKAEATKTEPVKSEQGKASDPKKGKSQARPSKTPPRQGT